MSPRKKFAQLSLFEGHRHCGVCGDVTRDHVDLCAKCQAERAALPKSKRCPICQAEPGDPCATEAGHVLPFEHADRIGPTEYVDRVRAGRA